MNGLEVISLQGTPSEMGGRYGELLAEGTRAMCETRMALCLRAAEGVSRADLLALAREALPAFASYAPDTYAEFCGIAEGAGVSREELLIGNGYTDFVDLVGRRGPTPTECTACAVLPRTSADGKLYLGQTWDMNASAYPHVVALRRLPAAAPPSLTLTTAGCLSLIGVNECGIAIGNTNLVPHDARPGVMYLAVIHTALAQTTFEAAVRAVAEAPRMSGHVYYLGGPHGQFVGIETTALRHAFLGPDVTGLLAHANHYTDPELQGYVGQGTPSNDTTRREARMWELLRAGGRHDMQSLWAVLGDHQAPLCRHTVPDSDVRTCAAAVISPTERVMRMAKGYPCEASFVEVAIV